MFHNINYTAGLPEKHTLPFLHKSANQMEVQRQLWQEHQSWNPRVLGTGTRLKSCEIEPQSLSCKRSKNKYIIIKPLILRQKKEGKLFFILLHVATTTGQWVDISVIATLSGILGKRNANHRGENLQSYGYKSKCSLTELQETHTSSYGYYSRFI